MYLCIYISLNKLNKTAKLSVKDFLSFFRLNRTENCADDIGFRFSKTKTTCVHFSSKHKLHDDQCFQLDGNQIKIVKEAIF